MNIPHLHNNLFKPKPQAILYCKTAKEILDYLNNENQIKKGFTIRGGGHNHEGYCVQDGKIVIDISGLKSYEITTYEENNNKIATVTVGAGLTNLEIIYLQSKYNPKRIVSTGECVGVGTAGYTLGGGWHLLCRQNGLSADSVKSLKIIRPIVNCNDNGVSSDAAKWEEVTVDSNSKDMKFILGSGGGHFGIVTEITYKTFKLENMLDVELIAEISLKDKDKLIYEVTSWLKYQSENYDFTSTVRFVKLGDKLKTRIFTRTPQKKWHKIASLIKNYKCLKINGKPQKFSPYKISELKEYKEYLSELDNITVKSTNQSNQIFVALKKFYQEVKSNAHTKGIQSYLGTPFYYELSHQADSQVKDTSSNYSCRTPRKHKVTSTFIKKNADLKASVIKILDSFFNNNINENNYSICTFHTVGGKAGSARTSYAFAKNDFLVQIQSWLPENFNNQDVEKDMVNWVNQFRIDLMATGHFEGAFINFLNDKIPTLNYYNDEKRHSGLLEYKEIVDPQNMINSSPLSKDYQQILDKKNT